MDTVSRYDAISHEEDGVYLGVMTNETVLSVHDGWSSHGSYATVSMEMPASWYQTGSLHRHGFGWCCSRRCRYRQVPPTIVAGVRNCESHLRVVACKHRERITSVLSTSTSDDGQGIVGGREGRRRRTSQLVMGAGIRDGGCRPSADHEGTNDEWSSDPVSFRWFPP